MNRSLICSLALIAALLGCSSGDDSSEATTQGAAAEDLNMTEADFECILDWAKVRKFRITNKLDHLDETLAVANNPGSGNYPVGTIIQLVPNEVMVKRRAGFNKDTRDWEFLFLDVTADKTTITARGTTDVVNGNGLNCFNCHIKAEPKWDLICEEGHGCDPIPVTAEQIEMFQNSDPRCD